MSAAADDAAATADEEAAVFLPPMLWWGMASTERARERRATRNALGYMVLDNLKTTTGRGEGVKVCVVSSKKRNDPGSCYREQ